MVTKIDKVFHEFRDYNISRCDVLTAILNGNTNIKGPCHFVILSMVFEHIVVIESQDQAEVMISDIYFVMTLED